jgi:hypothetical protein
MREVALTTRTAGGTKGVLAGTGKEPARDASGRGIPGRAYGGWRDIDGLDMEASG